VWIQQQVQLVAWVSGGLLSQWRAQLTCLCMSVGQSVGSMKRFVEDSVTERKCLVGEGSGMLLCMVPNKTTVIIYVGRWHMCKGCGGDCAPVVNVMATLAGHLWKAMKHQQGWRSCCDDLPNQVLCIVLTPALEACWRLVGLYSQLLWWLACNLWGHVQQRTRCVFIMLLDLGQAEGLAHCLERVGVVACSICKCNMLWPLVFATANTASTIKSLLKHNLIAFRLSTMI
jgi:hypothetical protein